MCPNFGAYWGTEPGSDGTTDSRYEFGERSEDGVRGKTLICRYCGLEKHLHAARSIRPILRHFLSESLPFVDCPWEDCENHGRNLFESMARKRRKRGHISP